MDVVYKPRVAAVEGHIVIYSFNQIFFGPYRPQGSNGICTGHPRHGILCSPDDVHDHSPHCLLHCLDHWWRHDTYVVMA